jgi:quinol monooxygenase YgiN
MAVTYFARMVAKEGQADNVLDLLLVNPRCIEEGEQGNIVFGVHRSVDNLNEFWLYETWESEKAVNKPESSEAFQHYKGAPRPLVESESVIWGNTKPVKILGYHISRLLPCRSY